MEFRYEKLAAFFEVSGFVVVETCAAYVGFEFLGVSFGIIFGCLVLFEKRPCDYVDAYVGGLRGEHSSDQQLQRVIEIQRGFSVRVLFLENLNYFRGSLLWF